MRGIKRREFITLLGSAASWPFAALAQQPRLIGVLTTADASDARWQAYVRVFTDQLRKLGWIDGQNLRIEYRSTPGDAALTRTYAAEMVALAPDVIFSSSTANLTALQRLSPAAPIVFIQVSDPVAQGFVLNMARPGGNITGFAAYEFTIGGKWLDLLKQMKPTITHVAVMFNPQTAPQSKFFTASNATVFRSVLSGLGWVEGRNLRIEWRWAAGDASRALTYAAELVALNPDLLFGDNTFVVRALQQAAPAIPTVFARVTDPIGAGFVSSLARPGGNITGFADGETSASGKLAELMREIAPDVTRVAILNNVIDEPTGIPFPTVAEVAEGTTLLGMKAVVLRAQSPREIEDALSSFAQEPNGGLISATGMHRQLIIDLAARYKLPAVYRLPIFVKDGGLMSYGPDHIEQYGGAAGYVDRILKGAKPGDLSVQLPIKYRLVVNMKTAKALGRDIPLSMLMRIDEVIE
jgi:putative ABC transport system substrate-binding protein